MTLLEKIKTLFMVPMSRVHLLRIKRQLKQHGYDKLIQQSVKAKRNNNSIAIIVKAYFWASRTIKNCDCLPRSIALYQKLRASGYPVEHKFGVNKQDQNLAAHAWVEYDNQALNESKDLKQRFIVMNKASDNYSAFDVEH